VQWLVPVIPALQKSSQKDGEFEISLGYIARPYRRGKKKKKAE
jgi:hypothetical protein